LIAATPASDSRPPPSGSCMAVPVLCCRMRCCHSLPPGCCWLLAAGCTLHCPAPHCTRRRAHSPKLMPLRDDLGMAAGLLAMPLLAPMPPMRELNPGLPGCCRAQGGGRRSVRSEPLLPPAVKACPAVKAPGAVGTPPRAPAGLAGWRPECRTRGAGHGVPAAGAWHPPVVLRQLRRLSAARPRRVRPCPHSSCLRPEGARRGGWCRTDGCRPGARAHTAAAAGCWGLRGEVSRSCERTCERAGDGWDAAASKRVLQRGRRGGGGGQGCAHTP
jgi:hypothetical protein